MRTAKSAILRIIRPLSPRDIAVSDIPSDTPACGRSVIPRYFWIVGAQ